MAPLSPDAVLAYLYTGHSLGLAGTIAAVVGIAVRLSWMFAHRRRRR